MTADFPMPRRKLLSGAVLLSAAGALPSGRAHARAEGSEGLVAVPGGNLWHWDTGSDGPVLVFDHPATGSHHSWRGQRDYFAGKGFRVIGYSRWGHAGSDKAPSPRRAPHEDLLALLNAKKIERAHLVGVAAGSATVAPLVATAPHRVLSAAIVGSVVGFDNPAIAAVYTRLRPANFHQLPPEFRELSGSYRASSPAGVKEWLQIQSQRPGGEGALASRRQAKLEDLTRSRVPLLFATGDADLYAPPFLMKAAADLVPNARFAVVRDAGHAPFWEQPEQFNALILDHIRFAGATACRTGG
jgi:pimeloyl-ACP methyl ester carboxylesterase